ncbi:MAG: DUF763 domain-containing protein [Candidatus Nanohaloarchaeota archaeon QJJ-9]|nr:DUF763 domain-containing protein [Candidatus Nanohaloarchaeota archaeon QJJ-9]
MPRSGTADLPLHNGKAPRWLFERMEKLGKAISEVIIEEYSRKELLERLANPYWFQGFGCVLGFDWHSSGLTTTTMGALKEGLDLEEHGVAVLGGKGVSSTEVPQRLESLEFSLSSSTLNAIEESSRMSASVDDSCVQDSYSLYHHTMVVTESGDWAVVQQGMSKSYARRYHWLSDSFESYFNDPQEAIASQERRNESLNLVSNRSEETRQVSLDLVNDDPDHLKRYVGNSSQSRLTGFTGDGLDMPSHHRLEKADLSERSIDQLKRAYEIQPDNYKELVGIEGVGKKSLRALALIAEIVHGTESSWKDPAKYSYAHGGKDGTPYPVDRENYDKSIEFLQKTLGKAEVERKEKKKALKRLNKL